MRTLKRCMLVFVCIIFLQTSVLADTFKFVVETMEPFSTANPSKTLRVKVVKDYVFDGTKKIEKDSIIDGNIALIVPPKKGKRDAFFYYQLTSYTSPSTKNTPIRIKNEKAIAKVSPFKEFDLKETSLSAGTTVAGLFVDNVAYPINFARGIIEPYDDKSRLASGFQHMYEKSFFSYASDGKDMVLNKGDKITLTIKYVSTADTTED